MKKFLVIFIALCMIYFSEELSAQHRPFGFGVSIGEPTGFNAKLWTSETEALDFGVGWSIGGDRIGSYEGKYNGGGRIHFHFDYLLHLLDSDGSTGQFPIYYGIGGRFNAGAGYLSSLAVRFVVGLVWMPRESTIDMFVEFVPSLQLTSLPGLAIDSAIGVRYYF